MQSLNAKRMTRIVILMGLMLLLAMSVTSASAGTQCHVYAPGQAFQPVFSAPSLMSPIINELEPQFYYQSDGYVMSNGMKFYRVPKHDPGNESTGQIGYVHEWDVIEFSPCPEAAILHRPRNGDFTTLATPAPSR
jgi:hypothetical protein